MKNIFHRYDKLNYNISMIQQMMSLEDRFSRLKNVCFAFRVTTFTRDTSV